MADQVQLGSSTSAPLAETYDMLGLIKPAPHAGWPRPEGRLLDLSASSMTQSRRNLEKAEDRSEHRSELSLDPAAWDEFRALAHRSLDDALDFVENVRERPVWRQAPQDVSAALLEPLPIRGEPLQEVYLQFQKLILPYVTGNIHPRFFGWVHGTGLASGIIAEMLAAAMNANCGGRDHGAIYVERAVLEWWKSLFGLPPQATGLLVSGTSMANLIGLAVARNSRTLAGVRAGGLKDYPNRLVAYASAEGHESIVKAVELLGLGSAALRKIPVNTALEMDIAALRQAIHQDRSAGLEPFCVVGTAGSVNTGAIDDLATLASLCADEKLWFHVDGAFGALCILSDRLRSRIKGIERADSIAFDFHKWMFVQYDAGCILVRNGDLHRASFSMRPPYLKHLQRGLAGGQDWPCEFGPELSRGFRALKVWFAMKEHGTQKLGQMIEQNCAQAQYLANRVQLEPELELLAPVKLNVVCFRFRADGLEAELDKLNEDVVADIQEAGIAAPSTTRIRGSLAIRVAITNHRSRLPDFDILVDAVLEAARRRALASAAGGRA
jgi:aromatic-L-amino-acid/L-tryptophan decarboxylase